MVLRLKQLVAKSFFVFLFLFVTSDVWAQAVPKATFRKIEIEISYGKRKKSLLVDLAETPAQHAYGLMNRTKMGADEGMLFAFPDAQPREFWMKDTLIDLDIAYIDKNKKIIDIQQMKAVRSILQKDLPTYPSKGPAQYALEMNSGWFKKNGFPVGSVIGLVARPKSDKK